MPTGSRGTVNRWDNWPQIFRFARRKFLERVRTAVPGHVVSYDPRTRRARVQPAIDRTLAEDGTSVPRAPLLDVPILWPGGGGWFLTFPLEAGDAVQVIYNERDISAFKRHHAQGAPPSSRVLAGADAAATPTFHPLQDAEEPESTTGVSIQSEDGETAITLEDGHVRIKARRITLEYEGDTISYP